MRSQRLSLSSSTLLSSLHTLPFTQYVRLERFCRCFKTKFLLSFTPNLQWFTAIYIGLGTAIFWCLLINGFVGFQFAEDGTPKSLWVSDATLFDMLNYTAAAADMPLNHFFFLSVHSSHFGTPFRHWLPRCNCDIQRICRHVPHEADWIVDHGITFPSNLCRHLRPLTIHSCLTYTRRQMGIG